MKMVYIKTQNISHVTWEESPLWKRPGEKTIAEMASDREIWGKRLLSVRAERIICLQCPWSGYLLHVPRNTCYFQSWNFDSDRVLDNGYFYFDEFVE